MEIDSNIQGNQVPPLATGSIAASDTAPKPMAAHKGILPKEQSQELRKQQEKEQETPKVFSEPRAWIKDYSAKLANNTRWMDLFARLKDFYKLAEIGAPWLAAGLIKNSNYKKNVDYTKYENEIIAIKENLRESLGFAENYSFAEIRRDKLQPNQQALFDKAQNDIFSLKEANADIKMAKKTPTGQMTSLQADAGADLAFFALIRTLSVFGGNSDKNSVMRVYGEFAENEFGKKISGLTFNDLKKSTNPMVSQAAKYYSKKSSILYHTDWVGLIRLLPLAIYKVQEKGLFGTGIGKVANEADRLLNNPTQSVVGKLLSGISQHANGIKLLMAAKAGYFTWYFGARQTGSFYEAKNIWNKTEGIANTPNRALNENVPSGDFVKRQDIRSLYINFREENPEMGMAAFTQDDPLASRVFEETARYLNHTYMPKLFAINEPQKQRDLPQKRLTHAMLVELMGSGGIRVEDALGSALRLEVMAFHGHRGGVKAGIKKYREISDILENIPHPERSLYSSQKEAVEAVHDYLQVIDKLGREYLEDFWPPQYVHDQLKQGFIDSIFEGKQLSAQDRAYMESAMVMDSQQAPAVYIPDFAEELGAPAVQPVTPQAVETPKASTTAEAVMVDGRKRFTDTLKSKTPEALIRQIDSGLSPNTSNALGA